MFYLSVLGLILTVFVKASEWNYGNVSEWPEACQYGTEQSPINIVEDSTVEKIFSAFEFTNYEIYNSASVKNNGHSVAITFNTTEIPTLSGGGLIGEYILDHLHFHWESEHMVNGDRYPLEMHLVHYSVKYSSLSEAALYPSGVAVLGVLFQEALDNDRYFIPLIEVMQQVEQYPDEEVELLRPIAARSFLPRNTADYFRYTGSLTTPNCNEGVIWTVFLQTLHLSADQITHFQSVWSHDGPLKLNYRAVQPLNGRVVTVRNIPVRRVDGGGSASITASVILIFIFATLSLIKNRLL